MNRLCEPAFAAGPAVVYWSRGLSHSSMPGPALRVRWHRATGKANRPRAGARGRLPPARRCRRIANPVAPVGPLLAALGAPGVAQPIHLELDQPVRDMAQHLGRQLGLGSLVVQRLQRHPDFGHGPIRRTQPTRRTAMTAAWRRARCPNFQHSLGRKRIEQRLFRARAGSKVRSRGPRTDKLRCRLAES